MNSISASNGYPYPPTPQSQMNVASTPTQRGFQENQVAFTEDEARVLQQMIRAGVVSAAVVGMSRKTELNTSTLGALGILQTYWQDDDRLNNLGYKLKGYGDRIDVNAVNRFYLNKDGKTGRDIWGATTKKNGLILTDKSTNIAKSASGKPLFTTDMHTVDADGKVLKMTKAQNGFSQKFGNAMPNIKYDNRGTLGDSKIGGHAGPVAESASQYAKLLRELDDLKVAQKDPVDTKLPEGLKRRVWDSTNRKWTETMDTSSKKAARATKIAAAQKQYLALDQIRLEEASKALKQQQNVLAIEKAALEQASTKGITGEKLTNQQARVTQLENMVQAQKEHVIKLNSKNAQFVATNTAKNIDTLTEQIMKDPNWRQKGANPFNAKGAKNLQMNVELSNYGFTKEQIQAIQTASGESAEAVKQALLEATEANKTTAKTIARGLKEVDGAKKIVGSLDEAGEAALKTTVDAKSAAGGVRNSLGVMGKVTKGLAIVGTALEVLNFGNNMKNGDHRKAAADLTTAVITGAGTALLAGMFLSGVGTLPALAISAAIGMGMSAGVAPLVDKGYKALGFTNQNERDAQKAKVELQQFNQTLASAPTAMATA